jgi:asparagine N-glycosylation enzyme membrane subunit Stt3
MGGRPSRMKVSPLWRSLIVALVGGAVLALISLSTQSAAILLSISSIVGFFTAASVFRYGSFEGQRDFLKALVITVVFCNVAIFCRRGLCFLLCSLWDLTLCECCLLPFMYDPMIVGDIFNILAGLGLSFTLGRQSLDHML